MSSHLLLPFHQALALACESGVNSVQAIITYTDHVSNYALRHDVSTGAPSYPLPKTHSLTDLLNQGQSLTPIPFPTTTPPNHPAILLPTSGTTGFPKLSILPSSFLARAPEPEHRLIIIYAREPLRQSIDVLNQGGRIGVWSGSAETMEEDIKILRPTVLGATPAFYGTLYHRFKVEVARELNKADVDATSTDVEVQAKARKIRSDVLDQWKRRPFFGPRCKVLTIGGASSSEELKTWMWDALGACVVIDGYGCTETGGIARMGDVTHGSNIMLRDAPEYGYTTADKPYPRGEILASTSRLIPGYFNNPTATENAFVNMGGRRYFRTGDAGEMREGGKIVVIDRLGSLFKLAQGLFVSPERVEDVYRKSVLVEQCFVWGCGEMSGVGVVVVGSEVLVERVREELKGDAQVDLRQVGEEVAYKTKAMQLVMDDLRRIAVEEELAPWEIPSMLVLESEPFTEWNGLLSSIGKMCRPALVRKYRDRLMKDIAGTTVARAADVGDVFKMKGSTEGGREEDEQLCSGLRLLLSESLPNVRAFSSTDSPIALGADSLALARLASSIRERFGVPITLPAIARCSTLMDVQELIFGGGKSSTHLNIADIDWEEEVRKAWEIVVADDEPPTPTDNAPSPPRTNFEPGILVTGASGFIGIHLISALLSSPTFRHHPTPIYCLIRGPDAPARLASASSYFSLPPSPHLIPIEADISQPLFKLPHSTYTALQTATTKIYHLAAMVNGVLPYAAHHPHNVVGTALVVKFALGCSEGVKLCHVSTLSVFGGVGEVKKEVIDIPSHGLRVNGGYGQSKWVAERVVERAVRERGMRAIVVRVGTVSGSSGAGRGNARDSGMLLVKGLKDIGCWCDEMLPDAVIVAPVDWVAQAIVRLGDHSGSASTRVPPVYHLTSQHSVSFAEIMAAAGITRVPKHQFEDAIRNVGVDETLYVYKDAILAGIFARRGTIGGGGDSASGETETAVTEKCLNALNFPTTAPVVMPEEYSGACI
ncbi:hypothetical protein HDV00_010559 [Rhizophlyctis rosea]|nr:hypothetical protein HDV00_010559 [Rhizophlyctis rosea]